MKKILLIGLFFLAIGLSESYAQCPMCRTAIESGMDKEHAKGKGLNDGILYLLATPYLAVAIVGGLWYRRNRRK